MAFKNAIAGIFNTGHQLEVRGFVNVESGSIGVSTEQASACHCTIGACGNSEDCESCNRRQDSSFIFPSGDGDGIYVVAGISKPAVGKRFDGSLVVFGYKNDLAADVRRQIETDEDTLPSYNFDLSRPFAGCKQVLVGNLAASDAIYFADGGASAETSNAVVDIKLVQNSGLKIMMFVEDVSTSPEQWAERLASTQMVDSAAALRAVSGSKAALETRGLGLPEFIIRALLIGTDGLFECLDLPDEFLFGSLPKYGEQMSLAIGLSHNEPMAPSAIWMNTLLEVTRNNAADVGSEELTDNVLTWCYQGVEQGYEDSKALLERLNVAVTPERKARLLAQRGLLSAARKTIGASGQSTSESLPSRDVHKAGQSMKTWSEVEDAVASEFGSETIDEKTFVTRLRVNENRLQNVFLSNKGIVWTLDSPVCESHQSSVEMLQPWAQTYDLDIANIGDYLVVRHNLLPFSDRDELFDAIRNVAKVADILEKGHSLKDEF